MFAELWSRARKIVADLFGREPAPGRFETGSKFSWHGVVGSAPFVWPSRDYVVYIPKGRSAWRRAPLLVLCHGCKQTPEEFAQGTRIAEFADRHGFVVLLPRQKDDANPWRCWNWFDRRTMHGRGEAAIVVAQIRAVRRKYRIAGKRVLVAGMSAGGALAAVIGLRFPGVVTAVAVHSGLACGAATSALSAIAVMQRGPERDVTRIAVSARTETPTKYLPIPLLAVHGTADHAVAPGNAVALVRQYLALNGHAAAAQADAAALPPPDAERRTLADGRVATVREWRVGPRLVARYVEVGGLGHAWSGGDPALPYNDAAMPDATELLGDFFADALS